MKHFRRSILCLLLVLLLAAAALTGCAQTEPASTGELFYPEEEIVTGS